MANKINPYNFVPLESELKRGHYSGLDRLKESYYSGFLSCELRVVTPLISIDHRAPADHPLLMPDGTHVLDRKGNPYKSITKYSFLKNSRNKTIIQGSSLKGMTRSVFEAMTNSCLVLAATSRSNNTDEDYEYDDLAAHSNTECNNKNWLCPACQLFGTTESDKVHCQSRVRFTDAILSHGCLVEEKTFFLRELSSPKPRHPQTYGANHRQHGPIAGRKFYYHHKDSFGFSVEESQSNDRSIAIEQYAPRGTIFSFKVFVHDLKPEEFGRLMLALELDDGMGHKIGLGKAIGLGSCTICIVDKESKIYQPNQRYLKLNDSSSSTDVNHAPPWRSLKFSRETLPVMLREVLRLNKHTNVEIGYPNYDDYQVNKYGNQSIDSQGYFGGATMQGGEPDMPLEQVDGPNGSPPEVNTPDQQPAWLKAIDEQNKELVLVTEDFEEKRRPFNSFQGKIKHLALGDWYILFGTKSIKAIK